MKATINNIDIEGTPQEIAELIREFGITTSTDTELPNWYVYNGFAVGETDGGFFIK